MPPTDRSRLSAAPRRRWRGGHDAEFHAIDAYPLSTGETTGRFVTQCVVGIARINEIWLPGTYSLATKRNGPGRRFPLPPFRRVHRVAFAPVNGGSDGADSASSTIGVGDSVSMVKVCSSTGGKGGSRASAPAHSASSPANTCRALNRLCAQSTVPRDEPASGFARWKSGCMRRSRGIPHHARPRHRLRGAAEKARSICRAPPLDLLPLLKANRIC